jgi:hypothetical protein
MDASTGGIATAFAQAKAADTQHALSIAMLRQQALTERSLVTLLEAGADAGRDPPPAPEGQGQHVDRVI